MGATFAYLCDLYVDRSVRGTAVGTALVGGRCHLGGRVPESVDVIILATGFLPDVSFLPVAALDASGIPLHTRGVFTTVPALSYVGLERQRMFASATLRGVGPDARHVLDALDTVGDCVQ